jgi:hypothetical protein
VVDIERASGLEWLRFMATSGTQLSSLVIPDSFGTLERFLVEKTEVALADGIQLERWCRNPERKINEFPLNLKRQYALKNKAYGYFSDLLVSGQTRTVIGVRQEVDFGRITGPNPEERLLKYVLSVFLPTSHWKYPNGWPGGFTYQQLLYCTLDGQVGRYPKEEELGVQDWNLIGTKYRWSLFTVFLNEFVVKLGPVRRRLNEAATLVQHRDFVHIVEKPASGCKLEVAFGYPFIEYAPIPNFFGFGPGKFNWAVKLFSFRLSDQNDVRCVMDFAAGARPCKVFDFGKRVPCPLYGGATVLRTLSLGLYNPQRFHDWMDGAMVAQHARVHQALMEGSAKIFADWIQKN